MRLRPLHLRPLHLRAALAVAAALTASAAHAECEADPTEHRHLRFYLRLDTGVGGQHTSLPGGGSTAGASVGGTAIAVGGALAENLVLAGHVWGVSQTDAHDAFQLTGLGPQLTVYYAPVNVYVSITPSLTVNSG